MQAERSFVRALIMFYGGTKQLAKKSGIPTERLLSAARELRGTEISNKNLAKLYMVASRLSRKNRNIVRRLESEFYNYRRDWKRYTLWRP